MKKAFTLIELLVVIAVIAILAAMLMPALEKARQKARESACRGNVHNIGLSLATYRSDYGTWIAGAATFFAWGPCQLLGVTMMEYLDDWDVLICPSLDTPYSRQPYLIGEGNAGIGACRDPADDDVVKPFHSPAEMAYFYDELRVADNAESGRVVLADGIEMVTAYGPEPANHIAGSNLLYADNAVGWSPKDRSETRWELANTVTQYNNGTGWWWTNVTPTDSPWVRYGYIGNPRMEEDDVAGDLDDVYACEGVGTQWGVPNPNVANGFWAPAYNCRGASNFGFAPSSTVDSAVAGGMINPDNWWGLPDTQMWRGRYAGGLDASGADGWAWGVPTRFEGDVYE